MNAIILSVGDELILGQTVDTNSAWLSARLASVGCRVLAHVTVGDDQTAIEQAIHDAAQHADVVIVTGGLGPTPDDLTRQALAAVMNVPLELNEPWLARIRQYFAERGRVMPESNSIQAKIPRGATILENDWGTAAGIRATLADASEVFVIPGVPAEMKGMFDRDLLPAIARRSGGAVILSRTLHTFGLGESAVAERLGELMQRDRNPSVGTTVSGGVVSLRINARYELVQRAVEELERTAVLCHERLGDLIYGQDETTLQESVAALLVAAGKTVTTAESCTGGLLAKMLTDVSGSSAYFNVGFVTYSNRAKYERLGVPTEMINVYGAVSEPVVQAIARNARRLTKADYALAISGVAGPTGGTPTKPVGTICIALAAPPPLPPGEGQGEGAPSNLEPIVTSRTFNFPGDRDWIRDRAAKMALAMLRFQLLGETMPF